MYFSLLTRSSVSPQFLFQQIYPVLAVFASLGPRLRDVKPSRSAGSLLSICARKSRGPAWHGDARRQNGRSSRARRNKSLRMKNHLEEMVRNSCPLRFINGDTGMDHRTNKSVSFRHRYRELRINACIQAPFFVSQKNDISCSLFAPFLLYLRLINLPIVFNHI